MKGSLQDGEKVIEVSLKAVEVFSIISSAISLVLGIVAIVLSVLFYKMSEKSSKEVEKAAHDIDSNVKKLEMMFEKMYTDTFGMVKETVHDMRQYVYRKNGTGNGDISAEKIESKTNEIVNKALEGIHENSLNKEQVRDLVLDLIEKSKDVEQNLKTDSYIDRIKGILLHKRPNFMDLLKELYGEKPNNYETSELFSALQKMRDQNIIVDPFTYDEDGASIYHSTKITLKEK
ncbi:MULTISPECIES: hypothetical protein [Bacillus]|uniref:hypothetical protein n=1 Tax=Bacillus TaxID=1386 RepID=UPI001F5AB274|nr:MULTISPECIES: hypothetical protein [Bacillus cereus group]USL16098.1 hypothetical protein LIT28_13230 [Bacillus thuringiensis]